MCIIQPEKNNNKIIVIFMIKYLILKVFPFKSFEKINFSINKNDVQKTKNQKKKTLIKQKHE